MSKSLSSNLLQLLYGNFALYTATLSCHWNIEDPRFFSLHKMLEDQYEELAEHNDIIAERIRQLGAKVPFSLQAIKETAHLEELSGDEMLRALASMYEKLAASFKKTINEYDQDPVTVDTLVKILDFYEKTLWMINSHLPK